MHVVGMMKSHILKSPPPTTANAQTITFYKSKPDGYGH
jgi:hypothetical protein